MYREKYDGSGLTVIQPFVDGLVPGDMVDESGSDGDLVSVTEATNFYSHPSSTSDFGFSLGDPRQAKLIAGEVRGIRTQGSPQVSISSDESISVGGTFAVGVHRPEIVRTDAVVLGMAEVSSPAKVLVLSCSAR